MNKQEHSKVMCWNVPVLIYKIDSPATGEILN